MSAITQRYSQDRIAKAKSSLVVARSAQRDKRRRSSDPADFPYPDGDTVHATFEDVQAWAAENGVPFRSWDDLRSINDARDRCRPAMLPFERWYPMRGRFG